MNLIEEIYVVGRWQSGNAVALEAIIIGSTPVLPANCSFVFYVCALLHNGWHRVPTKRLVTKLR